MRVCVYRVNEANKRMYRGRAIRRMNAYTLPDACKITYTTRSKVEHKHRMRIARAQHIDICDENMSAQCACLDAIQINSWQAV